MLKEALLRRNGLTGKQPLVSEILGQNAADLAAVLEQDGGDDDSDHDVQDLRYEGQMVASQEQRMMEKRRIIESQFGVVGPPADGTQTKKERQFVAVRSEGMTAEMAKQFLPLIVDCIRTP